MKITAKLCWRVAQILRDAGGGRITSADLADRLSIYPERMDTTNAPIRLIIKHAIEQFGHPIGSCSMGYYWITNDKDYMLTIDDLKSRRMGLDKRIRAIHRNYVKSKKIAKTQTELF